MNRKSFRLPGLLVLTLILFSARMSAQGNLQFNSVLRQKLTLVSTLSANFPETTTNLVVPTGQVWKIESANVMSSVVSSGITYKYVEGSLLLDGTALCDLRSTGTSNSLVTGSNLPVWLGPGTYPLILRAPCTNCNANITFTGTVSGIIFNLVP